MTTAVLSDVQLDTYLNDRRLKTATKLLRKHLLDWGYVTRYSIGALLDQNDIRALVYGAQGPRAIQWGEIMGATTLSVGAADLTVLGRPLHCVTRIVVFTLKPISLEVAKQCLTRDILRLSPSDRDRVCPGLGHSIAPESIPACPILTPGIAPIPDARAAAPEADHGLNPYLNDILARHARAAYCEQIDCLLVSSLQDGPPAAVAAKLTAALTILREQFAASAI